MFFMHQSQLQSSLHDIISIEWIICQQEGDSFFLFPILMPRDKYITWTITNDESICMGYDTDATVQISRSGHSFYPFLTVLRT